MILVSAMLLFAAQALQPADVPQPVAPATPAASEEAQLSPEDASEIAARKRLNVEVKARLDETAASHAAAVAAHREELRRQEEAAAKAQAEYEAARAVYEQRQREIADWQACADGDRSRCRPRSEQ